MISDILKLISIGAIAAVPPGPVAVMVLQKTLCHGKLGGMVAGTGSGLVDTAYAALSLLAVGIISSFIDKHGAVIMLLGGLLVTVIGLVLATKTVTDTKLTDGKSGSSMASFPIQAALCALANPGAFALMLSLMALFRISPNESQVPVGLMLVSVWCGEMLWWTVFTSIVDKVKEKISVKTIPTICRIAGDVVFLLGLCLSAKGLITLL